MRGSPWRALLVGVWSVAMVAAAAFGWWRTVEPAMPVYLELAAALRLGPLRESFEPLGYSWLISVMPVASLEAAVKLLHWACFVVFGLLVLFTSRRHLDAAKGGAQPLIVVLAAVVLLSPYGLVNLARVNDNGVNIALVFLVYLIARAGAERRVSMASVAAGGALLGALTFIRPNVVSLVPLIAFAGIGAGLNRAVVSRAATCGLAMVLTYAAASLVVTGRPLFWPQNGPYNLLAGNNPAALENLKVDYNAELSLFAAMEWCGQTAAPRDAPPPALVACARRFVSESPLQAASVTAYKFYNMVLRPNLRLADSATEVALQWGMVLLPLAWWAATLFSLATTGRPADAFTLVFILLFVLPFVLTNSDPRFRLPLDAVYATSLMQLAARAGALHSLSPDASA